MTTALDIVTDAAYASTAIGQAQPLSSEDANVILRNLNRMLGQWANENLMQFDVQQQTFPLTPGVASYSSTLLTSGRPVTVDFVYVTQGGVSYPVDVIDNQTYDQIAFKATSGLPDQVFIDWSMPSATFIFYPVPSNAYTATIDGRWQFSGVPWTLTTTLSLPAGYEAALVSNLAVVICPYFSLEPSALLVQQAIDSKAWLKRTNHVPLIMSTDTPIGEGLFNIYRGS